MSKIIKLTQQHLDELRRDFNTALTGAKLSDGKITFTKSFNSIQRKATLYFTELAYLKMLTLVREFDKEVAWHGIAKRGEDASKDEYIVSDILVYPQEVTGATVNTDQEKYQMWLMNHEDEVFNNIRMQGHSHVNMGTTPSAVDTSLYERILEQLDDDMFYIFLIWNKRNEKTIKIYDLAKNVLFETADVTVAVLDDGTGIERFVKDAKEMVQDKKYTHTQYGSYPRPYGYNGYYGSNPTYANQPTTTAATPKKEEPASVKSEPTIVTGKKKKHRKKKKGIQNACDEQDLYLEDRYGTGYDDEDDPYSALYGRHY